MKSYLIYYIYHWWGKRPFCNGKPERAPQIGDFVFPLCYRCSAIMLAFVITYFIFLVRKQKFYKMEVILSVIFMLPTTVDGVMQLFTSYVSTNPVRIVTGLLAGFGIGIIIARCTKKIFQYVFKES